MAAGDPVVGYDGVLKYKVGGQSGGGAWVEAVNISSVNQSGQGDVVENSTRATKPYKTKKVTLKDLGITFDMMVIEDDADYTAFRAAYHATTTMGIQFFDFSGGPGVQADYEVAKFEQSQDVGDVQKISVELVPCISDTGPSLI